MSPVSFVPAILALAVAMLTVSLIRKHFWQGPSAGHFVSIDGLRGYLAFFVFLHHSSIWYFCNTTGQWQVPPSNLYTHFGQSSVALFFMITSFLFFSKLIDGRKRPIDFGKLFVSRFLRLVPLYSFAMLLAFTIAAVLSGGALVDTPLAIAIGVFRWVTFTILGGPMVNGTNISLVVAGVTWSLPYEWFFYFSLPVFALVVGARPPAAYLLLGAVLMAAMLAVWTAAPYPLMSFGGGIVAAFANRFEPVRRLARRREAALVAVACLVGVVAAYPSPYTTQAIALLSVAFTIIACGNDLFGLLSIPASRLLGEMAYSLYMLHGIVLFVTLEVVLGHERPMTLSPLLHWGIVLAVTPVLVTFCFLTFNLIERPAMQRTAAVTAWLRSRTRRLPATALEAGAAAK